ncbi:MAG: orotidine-5'-phosphate decarboxylase [Oscillospiraceae bacterium]|nr:orotidine-5'-phosphate decarboxylase [Oscillospiraceae bacterium]
MKLIDRLFGSVATHGHVCLGLDTHYDYIPGDFRRKFDTPADAVYEFNRRIIGHTLDVAACYKVQIAYYEAMGLAGIKVYAKTLKYLRDQNAIVIADVKRGDIAKTAEMYAQAHYSGDFESDFITLNPYMGMDTLEPFIPWIADSNKGAFVLAATSNPGASDIEGLCCDGVTVAEKAGDMISKIAAGYAGDCGYSPIGAVVGCTNTEQTVRLRERLANLFFLIPGYGAQGGKAQDIAAYLKDGNGGVVNSSRGVLLAYTKPEFAGMSFDEAARAECIHMRDEILKYCGR